MMYVTAANNVVPDIKQDKQGGCTISVLKRGGWKKAWEQARVIAGWLPNTQSPWCFFSGYYPMTIHDHDDQSWKFPRQ